MSSRPHTGHTRRRLHSSGSTALESVQFDVLFRQDDADPVVIHDLADVGMLTFDLFDLGLVDGALVLVDERRQVTAILLDPPPNIDLMLRWAREPDIGAEFSQIILIVARDRIAYAPPCDEDIAVYRAAQRMCSAEGLLWMDLIVANAHKMQSIGIVCDPDTVWLDPVEF